MSMQNIGGLSGFSYFSSVKFRRAPEPAADMSSRFAPCRVYTESSSESLAGCCTLSILAPLSAGASSRVRPVNTAASRGMSIPPDMPGGRVAAGASSAPSVAASRARLSVMSTYLPRRPGR